MAKRKRSRRAPSPEAIQVYFAARGMGIGFYRMGKQLRLMLPMDPAEPVTPELIAAARSHEAMIAQFADDIYAIVVALEQRDPVLFIWLAEYVTAEEDVRIDLPPMR